ncbi:MAG: choice-of-anchor B family protein [Ignavibacteriae bacterium]|nr:choice-of-anchor B family protein [Ignavibacteriota bacterium]
MKKLYVLIFAFILLSNLAYSQLGNHEMYLLKNLNEHPGAGGNLYSALWGYVAPNAREYALLGAYTGTSFVDITDSADIHEVDFLPGTSSNWREMKTHSHYAYIVTDVASSSTGIQIVDLQYLPDSVHFVKNWSVNGIMKIHTISTEGNYLYINGGQSTSNGGIAIVDISDPENPVLRGTWDEKYVHDCRVVENRVFACNIYSSDGGTVTVIDVWNKDNPVTIGSWANNPNPGPHNCAITPNRKYCLVTDEINGNPRLLKIWDIQNLSNVVQVGTWQPTGITTSIVHNIEIYGKYAVVAHYTAGVRVIDISNVASPTEIAWYDTYPSDNGFTYDGCWGVYMFPSGKIIGSDRQTGLYVLKTTFALVTGLQGNGSLLPDNFVLSQNYPNPFNPSTKISFSIPTNSVVSLKVFDISGKEVATIVNDRRDAGTYEVTFDAGKYGLTSGVYFYKLTTPEHSETKRMILVK